jgi:tetratricopeptide (TPR) repeat protein
MINLVHGIRGLGLSIGVEKIFGQLRRAAAGCPFQTDIRPNRRMTMITRPMTTVAFAMTLAVAASAGPIGAQQARSPEPNDPEHNFEVLWQTYDRNYALFGPKRIDWDALYRVYRPMVTAETTDDELFEIMSRLLGHLNDNHVRLAGGARRYRSGILSELNGDGFDQQEMEDFSIGLVKRKYLVGELESAGLLRYGWLPDSIGYLRIRGFGRLSQTTEAIDLIITEFQKARAVVIDLRATPGGNDQVGKAIASRFADRKRLYMKTYERNGLEYDDFAPPRYFYVEPQGPAPFTKTLVVLTNRWGISAAENFALAMRVLPHATLIGDFTSGVFADVYGDRLPNGWQFGVSYKLFVDPTGFCWEGIGVPMDLRIINTPEDIAAGRDRVLEFALEFIERGEPAPRDVSRSVTDVRHSWAQLLEGELGRGDLEAAVGRVLSAHAADPDAYYVDEDEMFVLAGQLADAGRRPAAARVLELTAEKFPASPRPWQRVGESYLRLGNEVKAREAFTEMLERNRRSYPWEKRAAELAEAVLAGKKVLVTALEGAGSDADFAATIEAFRSAPAGFYFTENAVNVLGYRLLGTGQVNRAVEVFLINTEHFPTSANVWDSLGDGYRAKGFIDQAIASYEKALEIDPDFSASLQNLAELERQQ